MQHSNAYTFKFAAMVTIACSVLLAGAATMLKPRQEENVALDIKRNILASVDIKAGAGESLTRDDINRLYKENIQEYVINSEGDILQDKDPNNIDFDKNPDLKPLYEFVKDGQIISYIIPISGKGLWSTIYGYLALEDDVTTIKGITFYQHGETPGLGGEIDKEWFKSNFEGKRIRNEEGELISITVIKGKVENKIPPEERYHHVDGISGATLTARGVDQFLEKDLNTYEPFFRKVMQDEGDHNG
ncbi:MAG: NADH:ubiquinone reductase (Na(+)-transporting) subunit C [Caldithrix sp.]|nr:NADH:ubiquinone reductase (Na(+)-transporting) subunit C [Caldithrix sp.]